MYLKSQDVAFVNNISIATLDVIDISDLFSVTELQLRPYVLRLMRQYPRCLVSIE